CCLFFCQAEDGIRDDLVTGVQTCALPISSQDLNAILFGPSCARCPRTSTLYRSRSHFLAIAPAATRIMVSRAEARPPPRRSRRRSEERRVGKECRARWSAA